jgi:hypothetical protein
LLLAIDPSTGLPLPIDFGLALQKNVSADGHLSGLTLPLPASFGSAPVRVHLVLDTTLVATASL